MVTRRPNMPRVRPTGSGPASEDPAEHGTGYAGESGRGTGSSAPAAVNRNKVVPLGAAPGYDDEAAAAPRARPVPRKSGTTKTSSTKTSTAKPASTKTSSTKSSSAKPASTSSRSTANAAGKPAGARPATRPAVKRPGKRPSTPHEKRLRERAELSGAIRSGGGSGPGQPAAHQQPAGTAAPVPARAFSGRMLALAVILVVVTVLLLPSVGTYMSQRSEIAQLQSSIAEKQQQQDDLKTQISRWDDPAYVKAQARNRINLVMPGEKKYMVVGATGDDSAAGPQSVGDVRTDLPWVDSLWDTVVRSATD